MPEWWQAALATLAVILYGVYVAATVRTRRHAGRLNEQWENSASWEWNIGKWLLCAGGVGIFVFLQRIVEIPQPWRGIGFFASLVLGLIWGEWRVGNGFQRSADARDKWEQTRDHASSNPYDTAQGMKLPPEADAP
jgi:hypothetical protein